MSRKEPRHYTCVDDWVMLHPGITATQYRVYSVIKGNVRHTTGGVPESGFRVTSTWVVEVADGLFSRDTVQKALQKLARIGVLRRLNDPRSGDGGEFEFVVDPGPQYTGPRSVMRRATEVERSGRRGASFRTVPLSGHPSTGDRSAARRRGAAPLRLDDALRAELDEAFPPDEVPAGEPGTGIREEPPVEAGRQAPVTGAMRELAELLEHRSAAKADPKLHLFQDDCQRIAEACAPALDRGWTPEQITVRLLAQLNSKIHSPGLFLTKKAAGLGAAPRNEGELSGGMADPRLDVIGYDPNEAARQRLEKQQEAERRHREAVQHDPEARRTEEEAKEIAERARLRMRERKLLGNRRS